MNDLRLTVIRHDSKFHVQASDDSIEHRHNHPFSEKDQAWDFLRVIEAGLENGRDLNLALWECTS